MATQNNDYFKDAIKAHLDKLAEQDDFFAHFYARADKNLEDCCKYIISEVKKSGRCGFADEEIFGLAAHYYEEENDALGKIYNHQCKVVVNHEVSLSESEIAEAKKRAYEQILKEEKERLTKKNKPAKVEVKEDVEELSLF